MAGGMRSERSRPSLGERAADSGVAASVEPVGALDGPARSARPGGAAGRHCWVDDPPEWPGTWPGLLVEWRQRADGWHGRVAYTVAGPHGPVLVESWLPAARLRQR
ncbi:hypothetical protein OF117_19340 [Geodermatophilus sp. YIM 151500]|uniref:hypothetical protein n=1 Tax=Geodermatophilus sp. YIM 151500 TaxID=2984531 RepID=UPI0021E3BE20|nr:hypothetical protein [Geodermatophilus sp. YIM 151500]MCV2491504.1 hypothetical protein [Geodermatophilus sp. YIM 151500]